MAVLLALAVSLTDPASPVAPTLPPRSVTVSAMATVQIVQAESNTPLAGSDRVVRQVRRVRGAILIEFS